MALGVGRAPGARSSWANDGLTEERPETGTQGWTSSWNTGLGQSWTTALTAATFAFPGGSLGAGSAGVSPAGPAGRSGSDPLKSPRATGLSSDRSGLTQILATHSDDGGGPRQDTATFVYGTDRIAGFSSRKPNEERYYCHDVRGSNRTVTDERGAAVGTQSFDSWGVPDAGKHAGNEQGISLLTELFGYAGERQDAWTGQSEQAGQTGQVGVVQLRNRWYHPHYGRFLSQDPYPAGQQTPLALHRYAYAQDNPTTLTDPSGLFSKLLNTEADWREAHRDALADIGKTFGQLYAMPLDIHMSTALEVSGRLCGSVPPGCDVQAKWWNGDEWLLLVSDGTTAVTVEDTVSGRVRSGTTWGAATALGSGEAESDADEMLYMAISGVSTLGRSGPGSLAGGNRLNFQFGPGTRAATIREGTIEGPDANGKCWKWVRAGVVGIGEALMRIEIPCPKDRQEPPPIKCDFGQVRTEMTFVTPFPLTFFGRTTVACTEPTYIRIMGEMQLYRVAVEREDDQLAMSVVGMDSSSARDSGHASSLRPITRWLHATWNMRMWKHSPWWAPGIETGAGQ